MTKMEGGGMKDHSKNFHIAMFPWFAYGHINPFINLSNKLSSHGIQISFLSIPGNIPRIKSSLISPSLIQIIPLTIPTVADLPQDFDSSYQLTPQSAEHLKTALDLMQPQVKTLLSQLQPDIIIFDFIQYWIPLLASELGIKSVNFSVFSAVANAYLTVPCRMSDLQATPCIEDLKKTPPDFPQNSFASFPVKTYQARDFQYLFKSFNGGPSAFIRVMRFIQSCDALIYKSCTQMEGNYIEYLKNQLGKPLLLAGPAVPLPPTGDLNERWTNWLNQFSESSVIFCNFGSETYLSKHQIEELALGLELTNLPFFLVLNFDTRDTNAQDMLEEALPEGFAERLKNRGVVHTGWVQQQHILAHQNVGCYLNHSGFSSVIEGIVNDCQLVFVPQKGDQFLNSKLFSGDLKVGVEVNRRDEDGYFGKDDILEAVNIVMKDVDKDPGKSIRENHRNLKEFLITKEIEDEYVANLVKGLKDLACS